MRRPLGAVTAVVLMLGILVGGGTAAQAVSPVAAAQPAATAALATALAEANGPGHDKIVSEVPAQMPTVEDGAVWAFAEVGNQMVVGGTFTQVSSRGSDVLLNRPNIFIFDKETGQLSTTAVPTLNGKVEALIPGPTPGTVYAAGGFTRLNGSPASHVALINVATGAAVPGFRAAATNGIVTDLHLDASSNRLYLGGYFTTLGAVQHQGLGTLNATTGRIDNFMGVDLAEHHNNSGTGAQGAVGAKAIAVTPDASTMIAVGNFRTADGLLRDQVVMIDLTGAAPVVRPDWRTRRYEPLCSKGAFDSYMRDVDLSADGSFFVIVTTGGPHPGTLCDTAARFEVGDSGDTVEPTWINDTGGDTLWSVGITEQAVYIGGHQRWVNNTGARDSAGPGAVPRPGIAALDLRTGMPLDWNPGRNPRGAGAFKLYPTSTGLWMGQDTNYIGEHRYRRGKMAFFPLEGGHVLAPDPAPVLPGTVYLAAKQASDGGRTLYRINAGGSLVPSQDAGPDWAADSGSFRTGGSQTQTYSPSATLAPTVPAGTPTALFDTERNDPSNGPDMDWAFPVTSGIPIQVRLYFANRCTCTDNVGERRFHVTIDGVTRLSSYDVVADVGHNVGTMRAFSSTSDGTVNINFDRFVNNPMINAIEVVRTDRPEVPGSVLDEVSALGFNGTTATAPSPIATAGVSWRQARGAFWLDGKLFNGWSNGQLTSRSFDGTSFGPATVLEPWADPEWADVPTDSGQNYLGKPSGLTSEFTNLNGMFYLNGRLYYALNGSSTLFYRYFSPDSGVVGSVRFTAPSGFNFANTRGLFYTDGNIYAASSSTGDLLRIPFTNGTPSLTGTVVTGPSTGGVDWRSRAMFMIGAPPNQPPVAAFTSDCTDLDCDFDGTGSTDADGTVDSYAWDFGDGTTSTEEQPQHSYAVPGDYVVTLTVNDNDNDSDSVQHTVHPIAPNVLPQAAFEFDCIGLACSVDGRASNDSDGTIASYGWNFAGSVGADQPETTFTFPSPGTYDVALTVTDNRNGENTVTHPVTVGEADQRISFVGRDMATANAVSTSVTVPPSAQAGDTALLMATHNVTDPGIVDLPGWTLEESRPSPGTSGMTTTVWSRVLNGSDLGSTVTVTANRQLRTTLTLAVWSGADPADPVAEVESSVDASTGVHTTPGVRAGSGHWVVSYWSDKSSTTTAWTPPAGVTVRGTSLPIGSGRVTSLLADSGAGVPRGPVGLLTATTDAPSTRGVNFTITLVPVPPDQPPVAAFTSWCTNQHCAFDAAGSTDVDGSIDSYAWDFGDGETGSGQTPEHDYADPGDYQITLTVTDDDGHTDEVSHQVTGLPPHIDAVGATKANANAVSLNIQVPAGAGVGDTAVLFATQNVVDPNLAPLPGWTLEDTRTSVGMVSNVWTRTLTAADLGSSIAITADRQVRHVLSLAVYRGVAAGDTAVQVTSAAEGSTATHTTPSVTTAEPTWVLSYFADKSSLTTDWTPPADTQTRAEVFTAGNGRVTSLLVDSGDEDPAGSVGGLTATTDATSSRGVVMTVTMGLAP